MRSPFRDQKRDEETAVRGTNDDASACKLSAVSKGYYEDPFVTAFAKDTRTRSPLMNRGYYVRVKAIEQVVSSFCSLYADGAQVVLLGGGYDTLYFRSFAQQQHCSFFEVDYQQVISEKARVIQSHSAMSVLAPIQPHNGGFRSDRYSLICCDLHNVSETTSTLLQFGVDVNTPTIFISECVLIYVDPVKGSELIKWTAATFPTSSFVCYEQIKPTTAFGKTMIVNLQRQSIPLQSILSFPDIESQKKRYQDAGYPHVVAHDLHHILTNYVSPPPRVEIFDEFEEFNLIMQHYLLLVASKHQEALPF